MTFDKSKVYTALNADELKIGSRVVLCDSLLELKEAVETEKKGTIQNLAIIHGEDMPFRFTGDKYHSGHLLAYLIEPPAEPRYEAFESIESAMEAIKAHGGWVKDMISNRCYAIVAYDEATVETEQDTFGVDALFDGFVFADDGSPCGELIKQ